MKMGCWCSHVPVGKHVIRQHIHHLSVLTSVIGQQVISSLSVAGYDGIIVITV